MRTTNAGFLEPRRAYYRCKFPKEYAVAKGEHPSTVYVREDALTPAIDNWLAQLFDDDHIDDTCGALGEATGPDIAEQNRIAAARKKLRECDDKLARKAAEVALRPHGDSSRLSADEIKKLVIQLKGIVEILKHAHPEDRRAVYRELNLRVVYHNDGRMQVTAGPDACTNKCVGGGLELTSPIRQGTATGGSERQLATGPSATCRSLPLVAAGCH